MDGNCSDSQPPSLDIISSSRAGFVRREFLRSLGLAAASVGLGLGLRRAIADPAPLPVIQAQLAAARGVCPQLLVGVEIGTSKVCVAVGEARPDRTIKVLGVGHAPSRGVRIGEIVDFDAAQECMHEALADAEQKTDVMIRSVFVAVTGSHIQSLNNRGSMTVPEGRDEIDEQDLERVKTSAGRVFIPAPGAFLHTLGGGYHIDGQNLLNPIGMCGEKLEADFHIIHGIRTRFQKTIGCVRELPLVIEDLVFAGLASAQVVLTQEQKSLGALVIDIGGGTTDYILYVDGAVKQSGMLAVGGDHITNDIAMGLQIPIKRAERVKVEEGSVLLGKSLPGETVLLKDASGLGGKTIERETLNAIIHLRLRESFELLKRKLQEEPFINYVGGGIFITGGCCLLRGIDHLAEEVFGIPARVAHASGMSGLTSAFENPQFSTAIGLIRYAQAVQTDRQPRNRASGRGRFQSESLKR
jgi:cell division protein FtsA